VEFGDATFEIEVEDVVAEAGLGWAGFDFGHVYFGVGEVFEDCEERAW